MDSKSFYEQKCAKNIIPGCGRIAELKICKKAIEQSVTWMSQRQRENKSNIDQKYVRLNK